MFKLIQILTILSLATLTNAAEFSAVVTKGSAALKITNSHEETIFQSVPKNDDQKAVSYGRSSITIPTGSEAISFEVKGDGSSFYASVFLGENKYLHCAYEAAFSLKNTKWHKVTLPFSAFSRNDKPWNPVNDMGIESVNLSPEKITHVGFGRLNVYSRHNHPDYSFSIRNIQFTKIKSNKRLPIKSGLNKTKNKLKNKTPLKVLLLGDSITFQGKSQNHTYFALDELNALKHSKIVNAAMGGHTSRAGNIILSRSLEKMPQPDLTVIFFGANDCKAIQSGNGFSAKVFEKQLLKLIQNVNLRTKGQSEFLLVNGVPRVDKESLESTGAVETITQAYTSLSEQFGIALCDTISLYNKLPFENKKAYYKDTVHQTPEGLKFIGQQIAQKLK